MVLALCDVGCKIHTNFFFKKAFVIKKNIFVILLLISTAISTFYWSISIFRDYDENTTDIVQYKLLVHAPLKNQVLAPYAYRLLTPKLVYLLDQIQTPLFSSSKHNIKKDPIAIQFAFINLFFTMFTSITLYFFLLNFQLEKVFSFLGSLLYLTSYYVITWNYLPLVDASGHFFLILGLLFVVKRRYVSLLICVLIGMWAKETTGLLLIAALLVDYKNKILVISCIPGMILYVIVRFFILENIPVYEGTLYEYLSMVISKYTSIVYWFDLLIRSFFIFLPISIFSIYKNWKNFQNEFKRLLLFVIPIFAQTLVATDGGRLLFYAFPFVFYGTVYLLQKLYLK